LLLAPVLLAIGLAGCHQTPTGANANSGDTKSMNTKTQDVEDLTALEERFTTAFRAKDVNAIMQLCIPDDSLVVFDVHPPRQFKGPQAYRKDWQDLFNQFSGPLKVEISEMDVTAGGDIAYAHYIHHMVGNDHPDDAC
jgi:ketosteroid isomerase-like protein